MGICRRWMLCGAVLGTLVAMPMAWAAEPANFWKVALDLDPGDRESAIQRGNSVGDFLHGLANGFILDDETKRLLSDIREYSLELNLDRVHEMLPGTLEGGRFAYFQGRSHARDGYELEVNGDATWSRGTRFGDIDGTLVFSPRESTKGSKYHVFQDADMVFGEIGDRQLANVLTTLFREMETAVSNSADPKAIANAMTRALPATMTWLDTWSTVHTKATMTPAGVASYMLRWELHPSELRSIGYPHMGRFLKRMDELLEFELTLRDVKGHRFLTLKGDTETTSISMVFMSYKGAVVPFSSRGSYREDRMPLDTMQSLDMSMRIDCVLRYQGSRITVDRWINAGAYRVTDEGTRANFVINQMPRLVVAGDNVLMSWLISAADSTVGLERHANQVLAGIAEGPKGVGSRGEIRLVRNGEMFMLGEEVDTILIDNSLIRFVMRIAGSFLIPEDAVLDDLIAMEQVFFGHLAEDWAQARTELMNKQ